MNEASLEQKEISSVLTNYNVVADSVAGSGKTTTVLHIAKDYEDESILLLTYNKKLRIETDNRAKALGLTNLHVHNYHSFAVKYYGRNCHNDNALEKHLNKMPLDTFRYTMMIIDEAQDMTSLYHKFVCKIINDNNYKPTICILGDRYQSIYDFNGADNRYIIYGHQVLNVNNRPWKQLKLSQTFRVPKEIAAFINKCMLPEDRLITNKEGHKPKYLFCDAYGKRPFLQIMEYLKTYKSEEIFILAPSVRNENTPAKILANALTQNGIKVHIPRDDNEKLDEDIIRNKLVFSSFHQVKGLERPVTMVFHFDKGYFNFYNTKADPLTCPNTMYVATTRSLQHLTLIHHYQLDFLPFLNHKIIQDYCDVEMVREAIDKKSLKPHYLLPFKVNTLFDKLFSGKRVIDAIMSQTVKHTKIQTMNVRSKILCKNLKSEIIEHACKYFDTNITNNSCEEGRIINLPAKTKQNETYESVSDINEVAIPSHYEYLNTGQMYIVEYLNSDDFLETVEVNYFKEDSDDEEEKGTSEKEIITYDNMNTEKLLNISNKYLCSMAKVIDKLKQIDNYSWLSSEQLTLCMERLQKHISKNAIFGKKCTAVSQDELRNRILTTTITCQDGNNVYMFKCNEITAKDLVEHAINMYIYNIHHHNNATKDNDIDMMINKYKQRVLLLKEKQKIFLEYMPTAIKMKINYNVQKEINIMIELIEKEIMRLSQLNPITKFHVFNIGTHEIVTLETDMSRLRKMVEYLIKKKFYEVVQVDDEDFINNRIEALEQIIL